MNADIVLHTNEFLALKPNYGLLSTIAKSMIHLIKSVTIFIDLLEMRDYVIT